MKRQSRTRKYTNVGIMLVMAMYLLEQKVYATVPIPNIDIQVGSADTPTGLSSSLQMMLILTILALAPSILIMMTSFTRIVISLHFLKSALGTQQMPPNQIIIGLALFITFFIMSPVLTEMKTVAYEPYEQGVISQEQALEVGIMPLKSFMLRQTRDEDIKLFMDLSGREPIESASVMLEELPMHIVIPAFIISELRAGFIIGFLIYIPFIVIDMVVASTLMSMGMMMLPPAMIALPFKILLFILVDGWNLLIGQLVQTFR
ncbi:MAG: flagellar type III secretion system pore protein FliP [Cellulosilyticaceae bacterium]